MPGTEKKPGHWSVLAVVQSAEWRQKVEACFREIPGIGMIVSCEDFLSGTIHADSRDLHLMMIEVGDDLAFFEAAMACADHGFIQAGGPVTAVVDCAGAAQHDRLLDAGASRVTDRACQPDALLRLINFDCAEYSRIKRLREDLARRVSAIGDVMQGRFHVQTRREAVNLATMLSRASHDRRMVAVGLSELIINGIEHGCLAIGHDEKGRLVEEGMLAAEIRRRRALPQYAGNRVTVEFARFADRLEFLIADPGPGFDHRTMAREAEQHMKKHGRGILMAYGSFDTLEYRGTGNMVFALHRLKGAKV